MFNIRTTDYQWLKYFLCKKYEYDSSQHSSHRSFFKRKKQDSFPAKPGKGIVCLIKTISALIFVCQKVVYVDICVNTHTSLTARIIQFIS